MTAEKDRFDAAWLDDRQPFFQGVRDEIAQLQSRGVFCQKRIVVTGCWGNFGEVKKSFDELGLLVDSIADNDPNKQGVMRLGVPSRSVASLAGEADVVVLVVNKLNGLNSFIWRELSAQLQSLGLVQGRDFHVLFGGEAFRERAGGADAAQMLPGAVWAEHCANAKAGHALYCQLAEKHPGLPIWLMHQPSIGDLYIFSLFLPVYMGVGSIADCACVLVVTKNSTKKLAQALGYRHIELITYEQAHWGLLSLMRLMGDRLPRLHNAVFHGLDELFMSLIGHTAFTFRDSFTRQVFYFDHEVAPVFPTLPRRTAQVRAQYRALGLVPGKTVLIAPYAGHFEASLTSAHWDRLVQGLKAKGYSVCTNCGGAGEAALPGTVPAFIELQDSVEFVEQGGFFIGVRSGFCDVVCKAACKKIVLYEAKVAAGSIDFFGFESMGLAHDITELVNDSVHVDALVDEILGLL